LIGTTVGSGTAPTSVEASNPWIGPLLRRFAFARWSNHLHRERQARQGQAAAIAEPPMRRGLGQQVLAPEIGEAARNASPRASTLSSTSATNPAAIPPGGLAARQLFRQVLRISRPDLVTSAHQAATSIFRSMSRLPGTAKKRSGPKPSRRSSSHTRSAARTCSSRAPRRPHPQ
jgi:hypothetical protein